MPPQDKKTKLTTLMRQRGNDPSANDTEPSVLIVPSDSQPLYPLSTAAAPDAIELPPEAAELAPLLQQIARNYITARRRTGESLLESARWLNEAREQAHHGDWLIFLRVTGTSPDQSDRLLNIHTRAIRDSEFSEAIRRGWLGQTAAALLAPESVPDEIVHKFLTAEEPPKLDAVAQALRALNRRKSTYRQNAISAEGDKAASQMPQNAAFPLSDKTVVSAEFENNGERLIESLDATERAVIVQLTVKIERYIHNPQLLSNEDWSLIAPLALRLSDLLQHLDQKL